jgi:hypothetical protein
MTRGRVLVVSRIENGSIIATLTDAALAAAPYVAGAMVVVTAVNSITKFAENLQKWFGRAKSDEGKKRLYRKGKKTPGQTAAKSGSRVKVKHTTARGETLEAELTPAEVVAAAAEQTQAAEETKAIKDDRETQLRIGAPTVRDAAERLQQVSTQNPSATEVQAVVDVVVAVLQAAGDWQANWRHTGRTASQKLYVNIFVRRVERRRSRRHSVKLQFF